MTTRSLEVERKFDVPEGFELPDLTEAGPIAWVGAASEFHLDATYYDTPGMRLAAAGMTLRRRQGGYDAGWHLKRPATDGGRTEVQAPDDTRLPIELAAEIQVVVRGEPVRPVVRIRTLRRETPLLADDGVVLASVAEDEVESDLIGSGGASWRELEVELVHGDPKVLDDVGDLLCAAGARPATMPSKLARALGDRAPQRPDVDTSGSDAGRTLVAYLRRQRDELLRNDPLVRDGDPDGVHDMRVATRRLRSTLATFRSVLGDDVELRAELRWIATLLGAVRDGDVLANELIEAVSATAPDMVPSTVTQRIRRRLGRDVERARGELGNALNSERYFAMLDAVDRLVDGPIPDVSAGTMRSLARKRLAKADHLMVTAMKAGLVVPSEERDHELHDARKAYKKARYAVEVLEPDYGKPAARLVRRLKALQDLLGEHQDAVVATALLRELGEEAHRAAESEFGYGVLCEQQVERAAERRRQAPRVFRWASKPKVRSWLG